MFTKGHDNAYENVSEFLEFLNASLLEQFNFLYIFEIILKSSSFSSKSTFQCIFCLFVGFFGEPELQNCFFCFSFETALQSYHLIFSWFICLIHDAFESRPKIFKFSFISVKFWESDPLQISVHAANQSLVRFLWFWSFFIFKIDF